MAKDSGKSHTDPAFPSLQDSDIDRIADAIVQKTSGGNGTRRDATALPPGTRVVVRRCTGGSFTYGGRELDRNQVFELTGLRGDEAIVRLGYVQPLAKGSAVETCGSCGGQFTDASSATAHHKRRHTPRVERPIAMEGRQPGETIEEYEAREAAFRARVIADEERLEQADERAEDARAPLYLDQTKANRA